MPSVAGVQARVRHTEADGQKHGNCCCLEQRNVRKWRPVWFYRTSFQSNSTKDRIADLSPLAAANGFVRS